jgi:hypothetical protein
MTPRPTARMMKPVRAWGIIDTATGELSYVAWQPTKGYTRRHAQSICGRGDRVVRVTITESRRPGKGKR